MRLSHVLALGFLLFVGLSACSDENVGEGEGNNANSNSQTHWLASCTEDSDCDEALSCVCGVCTVVCEADDACGALDGGLCALASDRAAVLLCGLNAPDLGLCLPGCEGDGACGEGNRCVEGACVPDEVPDPEPEPEPDPQPEPVPDPQPDPGPEPDPGQALCEDTEGSWDEGSCGHYVCGVQPPINCFVAEPGCNCGRGRNFDEVRGCFEDGACQQVEPERGLCEESGGRWDEGACGHYVCGEPNPCRALIPGCDCGEGQIFDARRGCVESEACPSREAALCEGSGGAWDESACGHYTCGEPNPCDAIVPGCDCGEGRNFDALFGCRRDERCLDDTDEAQCEGTGGVWDDLACGHYLCGAPDECEALIPGCNCGRGRNFAEGRGCVEDNACEVEDTDEVLCGDTEGRWDPLSCGHYSCGEAPLCEAIIPGCDCGEGRIFDELFGCRTSDGCAEDPGQALCEDTGGEWDESACGHYTCGRFPDCDAIIPGCNCGEGRNFNEARGCFEDRECR